MDTRPIPDQQLLNHIKKIAKRLKKENPTYQHSRCLEDIVKQMGFQNYHEVVTLAKKQSERVGK